MGELRSAAARLLLLAALAAAIAAGAVAQPADVGNSSCAALADTPLDPNVSSWTFTLSVPPALVPALLDPSAAGSAGAEQAIDAAFAGSAITPNFTAWFGAVGVMEQAWILGEEPIPGQPLVPNSVLIQTLNVTGPLFNEEAMPEMGVGDGGSGGGALPMGPTVQVYAPRKGLYDQMTHATGDWDSWSPDNGDLMLTQVLWCDKNTSLITLLSNSTEPVATLGDVGLLSVAMRPILMMVGATNSSDLDNPIEYEANWVRRTYWPLEYNGQQTGYLILNVDFASQEEAEAGANPGKAELSALAHPPLPDEDYLEELRSFALALQDAFGAAVGSD